MNLNINYYIGEDLKEFAENPSQMSQHAKNLLLTATAEANPIKKAKLKGQAAAFFKILRELSTAEKELNEALNLLEEKSKTTGAVSGFSPIELLKISLKLRLYDVYRYQGKTQESEQGFQELLTTTAIGGPAQDYRDFTLQHLGKLYFDTKNYDKAMNCFEEALALRVVKEDEALISSTEKAIQALLYAKHS